MQLVDIKKKIEAENLRGVMGSLHEAQVPMNLNRMWFKMNSKTVISVATPSGLTESRE